MMILERKRGQAAAGAAVFVAILLGLIIMFIVLIPPPERASLLGEPFPNSNSNSSGSSGHTTITENLLIVEPGRIDYLGQRDIEHPLPVVNIYTRTESKVLAQKNVATAKRGVFSEEKDAFSFSLPDLQHTEKVLMSFTTEDVQGRLIISLNGEKIYDSDLQVEHAAPIHLPQNLLQEKNQLEFRVSSPGIKFWVTNFISLSNVQLVGEVTGVEAQSSHNVFLVSETEKRNLDRVLLKFQPDCLMNDVGKLSITMNGESIYDGVPDCDLAFVPIELSPDKINTGENQVVFTAERGTYVLSHVLIQSQLKKLEFPTYYFKLSADQMKMIHNNQRRLRLQLDFVDVVSRKFGELVFNGDELPFDTPESMLPFDLSSDALEGNNALKIKPQTTIEVRELKVDLVK